jgi:hypothetical protein
MNRLQTNYSNKPILDGGIANCGRLTSGFPGGPVAALHGLSIAGATQPTGKPPLVRAIKEVTEVFMITFLFIAVLAVLGFLAFTSPDGVAGPRHRH